MGKLASKKPHRYPITRSREGKFGFDLKQFSLETHPPAKPVRFGKQFDTQIWYGVLYFKNIQLDMFGKLSLTITNEYRNETILLSLAIVITF